VGTADAASATYRWYCCNLVFNNNTSYSTCRNGWYGNYTWTCLWYEPNGWRRYCNCCEMYNSQRNNFVGSAVSCGAAFP
jgi:hypothetical protein